MNNKKLYNHAINIIPGGVNSPVRAFKSIGCDPIFIKSGSGSKVIDENGKCYIDYIGSWGPMILGHAHPAVTDAICKAASFGTSFGVATPGEIILAELIISFFPSIEMLRMVNSGTEATMTAIRLARAYTNRDKIVKFAGCYHGHADSFLVAAGSGALTLGLPDSPGVTKATAQDTLIASFNDIESVRTLITANPDEIAAVIIEPIIGNAGLIPPDNNFLAQLRELTTANNILLIFDEVMTGFRVSPGGAQHLYNIKPDLTTLGKIIGGGLPVGAFGGRRDIMQLLAPVGPVYQAGTLSGNPLAVAAGIATLDHLTTDLYDALEQTCSEFEAGVREILAQKNLNYQFIRCGSMACLFFTDKPITSFDAAKSADTQAFNKYYVNMLNLGILLPPSQFEAFFISAAHTKADIEATLAAMEKSL